MAKCDCKIDIINTVFMPKENIIYILNDDYFSSNHSKLMLNVSKVIAGHLRYRYEHVIAAVNEEDLLEKLAAYRNSSYWFNKETPKRKFLIFIENIENVTIIFQRAKEYFIINMLLINFMDDDATFVTYQPLRYCNDLKYTNKTYNCKNLDQLKYERAKLLHDCTFSAISLSYLLHDSYAGYWKRKGILLMPLLFSEQMYNWTLNIIEPRSFEIEMKYALNEIQDLNGSDVLIASMYRHTSILHKFESSEIALFDTYIWLIPNVNAKPNVVFLLKVYHPIVWYLFIVGMLLIIVIKRFFDHNRDNNVSLMQLSSYVFHISFGIPYSRFTKVSPRKIYALAYLLCSYQLLAVYQGKLSSLLLALNHLPIKTMEQLLDSDLTLFMPYTTRYVMERSAIEMERVAVKRILAFRNQSITDADFVLNTPNVALMSRRLKTPFKFYSELTFISDNLTQKPQMSYVFPNGSYYISYVDNLIHVAHENGFISKWIKDTLYANVRLKKFAIDKTLTIKHLNGAFNFVIIGHFIAFLTLIIEIVCNYCKRRLIKTKLPFIK